MSNPFLDRAAKRGTSGHGRLSERRLAAETGMRLTPASGAVQGAKSDGVLGQFRMELKSTTDASISLKQEWLVKISHEALAHSQTPALMLSFVTPEGQARMDLNSEWVAIPKSAFMELLYGSD